MLPPIHKTIQVPWDPPRAFARFTREIHVWWPLKTHSVGGARAERVVFEERVGGRIVESIRGGEECNWGTVSIWDPPRRVAFTWHPGREPKTAQTVEVRFTAEGAGTRVELTHSNWEQYGDKATRARRGYRLGWGYVLRIFADRKHSPLVLGLDALVWTIRLVKK